uniref:hypothetical protein n=1 Tax=Neolewinella sp. TaxID=2993543 RepID=UPI003B515E9B
AGPLPFSVLAQSDLPAVQEVRHATIADLPVAELAQIRQFVRFGRTEEAIIAFDALLTRQPDWIAALTERATLLERLGRQPEAQRDRQRALRLNPEAARFYLARGSFSLLEFIALYPDDWFDDRYQGGEFLTGVRTETDLGRHRQRQLDQLAEAGEDDPAITFLQLKTRGEHRNMNELLDRSAAEHTRQWGDLMLGNLALLRQDLMTAVQYYDDAVLSGAHWPELYYNRGLAHILLNNYANGCGDLERSYRLGFLPGETMLRSLCTY